MSETIDEATYNRAVEFMIRAHKGQKRKGSELPYAIHPLRVAAAVRARDDSTTVMVVAALLHDVVEDTSITLAEIEKDFGTDVAIIVAQLTNEFTSKKYPKLNRKERKAREIERKKTSSREAKIIKLHDRLDNLLDSPGVNEADDFNRVYAEESIALVGAIAGVDPGLERDVIKVAKSLTIGDRKPDYRRDFMQQTFEQAKRLSMATGVPIIMTTQINDLLNMSYEKLLTKKNKLVLDIQDLRLREKRDEIPKIAPEAAALELEIARRLTDAGNKAEALVNLNSAASLYEDAKDYQAAHEVYELAAVYAREEQPPRKPLIAWINGRIQALEDAGHVRLKRVHPPKENP